MLVIHTKNLEFTKALTVSLGTFEIDENLFLECKLPQGLEGIFYFECEEDAVNFDFEEDMIISLDEFISNNVKRLSEIERITRLESFDPDLTEEDEHNLVKKDERINQAKAHPYYPLLIDWNKLD